MFQKYREDYLSNYYENHYKNSDKKQLRTSYQKYIINYYLIIFNLLLELK